MNPKPLLIDNYMIAVLTDEVRLSFARDLELVQMGLGKVLYDIGDRPGYVYFPIDCLVSLMLVMESGSCAEIAVVGNDGMVGVTAFMGAGPASNRAVVRSAGLAFRLSVNQFRRHLEQHPESLQWLLTYTQALLTQISQIAGCSSHHTVEQRLCRWLLLVLDRIPGNHVNMTHELIAIGLGVRREGITVAAGQLQRLNIIEYSRGTIRVIDRPKLQRMSCECYGAIKRETDRLVAPVRRALDAA